MLTAPARALRLDADERDPLVHVGQPVPPARGPSVHVEPAMLTLLDRLDTMPALVMTDLAPATPVG
jgi:hypothetical protein